MCVFTVAHSQVGQRFLKRWSKPLEMLTYFLQFQLIFTAAKLRLACKMCVNDNSSDEKSQSEKSAGAEGVVSALRLMVYSPFLPR